MMSGEPKLVENCRDPKAEPTPVMEGDERVKVWVGYDAEGEVVQVQPGPAATCFEVLDECLTAREVAELAEVKEKPNLEIKTTSFIRLYSNPSCWVLRNRKWYYVC
ncbi:MAG: hypothetical protein QNJ22_21125 [Desulfosarcinaceae bacterium]|nr:hypothetical protein [Desulfosarcinaceae bacterium]